MNRGGISQRHFRRLVKREREELLKRLKFKKDEKINAESLVIENKEENFESAEENLHEQGCNENINEMNTETLTEKLRCWYNKYNPPRESFEALLKILREEKSNVPSSLKSVLKRNEKVVIRTVAPGEYFHFGIENQLKRIADKLVPYTEIILNIGIDGLPLYKSSNQSLWPILGDIINVKNINVFLVGAYIGNKKPHNIDSYLHDFVNEINKLKTNGIVIYNKLIKVKVQAFICDAPAFVRGTVGHNSFHGCGKCTQIGKTIENVVTYSHFSATLRTDEDFAARKDPDHHKSYFKNRKSMLETSGIGMVSQFPVEPMHLLDLGVTRKILLSVIKGTICGQKVSSTVKDTITNRLISLVPYIPKEFARKPRSLDEVLKWKSTEFRQFILYTGIFALKGTINDDFYYHFLLLHSAYCLLSCPRNFAANANVVAQMLTTFVEKFSTTAMDI